MVGQIGRHLVAGVVLLGLLATLGTLQYRWLGKVSEAERDRMHATLRTRLTDFSDAFDRELTRAYAAFQIANDRLEGRPALALTETLTQWQSTASVPDLVDAVYLVERGRDAALGLKKLDRARVTLEPTNWPPELEGWRARADRRSSSVVPAPLLFEPLDASIPALIVSAPNVTKRGEGDTVDYIARTDQVAHAIIVVLNSERLEQQLLAPLVAKYFGAGGSSEYVVSIIRRDDPAHVVYTSDAQAGTIDERDADATIWLFDLQVEELARLKLPVIFHRESRTPMTKTAITVVRRTAGDDSHVAAIGRLMNGGLEQGAWQARARFRGGSLDALVAQSRRRSMAIGLGILALLAASFVLIVTSAARQQRLARQQIEFVAAVSHELRTPLAVIRSAGENLADGVVTGHEPVRRYGALIENEGRRLSDMVERVMTFAGITSGTIADVPGEVDLARIARDAVASARAEGRDRGISIKLRIDRAIPTLIGSDDGIRSAVQNVLGNAVKYSRDGGVVDVDLTIEGASVRITVVDRGIGIDADDVPQIFRPFFRGRRAVEAQVRGTGIGLSVVRHVVDAHGGEIRVESRPGEGTIVRMALPIAPKGDPSGIAAVRLA